MVGGEPNLISASQMDPAWAIWPKIGTTKQLDPKNKPVTAFLKFRKIDLTWRGQSHNLAPKSRFGLSFGSGKSDVDKN